MKISHIALWTNKLEEQKDFYTTYFNGKSNEKYINPTKGFESYFISFDGNDTTLEIMRRVDVKESKYDANKEYLGICHFAFCVGSKEKVLELTERLRKDGFKIVGEPRTSGDGYFESVVLDTDNNRVEIIA